MAEYVWVKGATHEYVGELMFGVSNIHNTASIDDVFKVIYLRQLKHSSGDWSKPSSVTHRTFNRATDFFHILRKTPESTISLPKGFSL